MTVNLTSCCVITLSVGAGAIILYRVTNWRFVASWLLKQGGDTYGLRPETLRSRFVDEEMVKVKTPTHHTHGTSAAYRSTGSLFIEQFAKGLARPVWFYQGSRSDQRAGRLTSREYFWTKDLTSEPSAFFPGVHDLVAMVDVDQYVDMNVFLADQFRPIVLYTYQPRRVAACEKEYSYTFNKDNEVVYRVSGGAEYIHQVWNYGSDAIKVEKTCFGYPYRVCTYLIDKRQVDPDHQIILLTPVKKWVGPLAFLASILQGSSLDRLKPSCGDFLRLISVTDEGTLMHTGRAGEYACSTSSIEIDNYLSSIARTSKVGLTLPQVREKVESLFPWNVAGVAILYEFHKSELVCSPPTNFTLSAERDVSEGVRRYQFINNGFDPAARPSLAAFMRPMIDGAFCPDICTSNDRQAIAGRIERVKNKTELDPFLIKCVDEFVDLFLGEVKGKLVPLEPEDVYENQARPTQRRILFDSEFRQAKRIIKSFMKREAYQKISDPRIISTIDGPDKADYSRFIYSLGLVLKTQVWYAFSKAPIDIAERVSEICEEALTAGNTDFSRMDGHVSEVLRYLEKQLMLKCFHARYAEQIIDLMRAQYNLPGYMGRAGGDVVAYSQGLARASGSPETSAFNSIANAFIAFLAFRMSRNQLGGYFTPREAYKKLGIYGGDDGVTADIEPAIYVKAAKRCGQKLEIEMVNRGDFGIKFLSRIYGPHVWFGESVSMCDLYRALSKFHVTVHMPANVSKESKLLDKSFAYWLTDQYTPVIGDFVSRVMNFKPTDYQFGNLGCSWNARYPKEVQYPNEYRDWFLLTYTQQIPEFEYRKFVLWLEESDSLTALLSPPVFHPTPLVNTRERVVVDGDIVLPPSAPVEHTTRRPRDWRARANPTTLNNRQRPRHPRRQRESSISSSASRVTSSTRRSGFAS